jgi:hypothetical protein
MNDFYEKMRLFVEDLISGSILGWMLFRGIFHRLVD